MVFFFTKCKNKVWFKNVFKSTVFQFTNLPIHKQCGGVTLDICTKNWIKGKYGFKY